MSRLSAVSRPARALILAIAALARPALAHEGPHRDEHLLSGLAHVFGSADHMLALLAGMLLVALALWRAFGARAFRLLPKRARLALSRSNSRVV